VEKRRGRRASLRRKFVCVCVCVCVCVGVAAGSTCVSLCVCACVGTGIISCMPLRLCMAPLCDLMPLIHTHTQIHTHTHSYKPLLGSGPYAMILFFALEVKRGSTKFRYRKKEIGMCVCVCVYVCFRYTIHTHSPRRAVVHPRHPPIIYPHSLIHIYTHTHTHTHTHAHSPRCTDVHRHSDGGHEQFAREGLCVCVCVCMCV
jgi:hypothetical protein